MKRNSTPEAGAEDAPAGLTPDAVRGRALAMLTRREHSRVELERKLGGLGAGAPLVAEVLDQLAELSHRVGKAFLQLRQFLTLVAFPLWIAAYD